MASYTRHSTSLPVPDDAAAVLSRPSPRYQVRVIVAFHNIIRNRPTPYSRPPSVERNSPPACGTRFTLLRGHRSNEAVELATAIPPAAPDAAADNDDEEEVLMHTSDEEEVLMDTSDEEEVLMHTSDEEEEEVEEDEDSVMLPETDDEDEEEEFVTPSPGVGGLMCRIPREHIDYDDMFYDDGVSVDMVEEFLRTTSCAEASSADGGDEELCVVCQDDLCQEDRTVGILECGHRFHGDCIGEWLLVKNVCPLCKGFGIGCFT